MHIYPLQIDPGYTKLGTSNGKSIYIKYRTMHIYP